MRNIKIRTHQSMAKEGRIIKYPGYPESLILAIKDRGNSCPQSAV